MSNLSDGWQRIIRDNKESIQNVAKITVDDIVEPFVVAHRGGADVYPENSIDAFVSVVATGINIIELDVQKLSDGSLAIMHDSTVDRTTTSSGDVSNYHALPFRQLVIDSNSILDSDGYENTKAPMLTELFDTLGNSVIYVIDQKSSNIIDQLIETVKAYGLTKNVIITSYTLSELATAIDNGMSALAFGDAVDLETASSIGVTYIGHSTSATDEYIANIVASGLKPLVWTIERRCEFDEYKAKGVVACFSDDPLYTNGGNEQLRTTDPFLFGIRYPGQLATSHKGTLVDGRWGYPTIASGNVWGLQGWGCPIQADEYTLTQTITYDEISESTSRWASVFICEDTDLPYAEGGSTLSNGYNVLVRANGSMEVYKTVDGSIEQVGIVAGASITQGNTTVLEIQVTATDIVITRTDLTSDNVITVIDTTFRGKYFHYGKNGVGVTFSNCSIV